MDYVYIVLFELEDKQKYCLWYTDEAGNDKLTRDSDGLIVFNSIEEINAYCKKTTLTISSDPVQKYDLDYIILEIRKFNFDANAMLNFWNIVTDISKTLDVGFYGDLLKEEINRLYDKLFFASNIPVQGNEDIEHVPMWNEEESELLMNIIFESIFIVRDNIFSKS